jgi:hypothetical protein
MSASTVTAKPCDVLWCRGYVEESVDGTRKYPFDCRAQGFHEGRQWTMTGASMDFRIMLISPADPGNGSPDESVPCAQPFMLHVENDFEVGAFEVQLDLDELDALISTLTRARGELAVDLARYSKGGTLARPKALATA